MHSAHNCSKSRTLKYLGIWLASTSQNMHVRKGQAWKVIISLQKIWKSNLPRQDNGQCFTDIGSASTFVWIRNMDFRQMTGEKFGWLLYQGLKSSPKHQLEGQFNK